MDDFDRSFEFFAGAPVGTANTASSSSSSPLIVNPFLPGSTTTTNTTTNNAPANNSNNNNTTTTNTSGSTSHRGGGGGGGGGGGNGNGNGNGNSSIDDTTFDWSFETGDIFNFSATISQDAEHQQESNKNVFRNDNSDIDHNNINNINNNNKQQQQEQQSPMVQVRIHEQVSALYDDFSQDGSVAVTGTIYIQPASSTSLPSSLMLHLQNAKYIQRIEERDAVSKVVNVVGTSPSTTILDHTAGQHNTIIHSGTSPTTTRGLKVDLSPILSSLALVALSSSSSSGAAAAAATSTTTTTTIPTEIPVANFFCVAKARPVPLLVKRKINVMPGFVRVGFKVRTNPHNASSLHSLYIVMAVPPQAEGEKCKMSIKGGSWNEMKRTLTWLVRELPPGKALEVQAQFPIIDGIDRGSTDTGAGATGNTSSSNSNNNPNTPTAGTAPAAPTTTSAPLLVVPKFPILVKAIYHGLYSELTVECVEPTGCETKVRSTGRLLHRKV